MRLEEGAEDVDREGSPHPPQCSRMWPRTQSSLFHWLVLESEGHSHHWKQSSRNAQWNVTCLLSLPDCGNSNYFSGEIIWVMFLL